MLMTQTMRWFGPDDPVSLNAIRQAGASEVVTALHEVANGDVWSREAIRHRREIIEAGGLGWTVVESLPVHEDIKTAGAGWAARIDAYRESLRNLAASGIKVVTYNFMPLLDWTRTDLAYAMPNGALALRFEWVAVAAYDIHILKRPGAEQDYSPETVSKPAAIFRPCPRRTAKGWGAISLRGFPAARRASPRPPCCARSRPMPTSMRIGCARTMLLSWKRSARLRTKWASSWSSTPTIRLSPSSDFRAW
jgi:mannonate dehydratase